jgi:hypothetical protein
MSLHYVIKALFTLGNVSCNLSILLREKLHEKLTSVTYQKIILQRSSTFRNDCGNAAAKLQRQHIYFIAQQNCETSCTKHCLV